MRVYAFGVLCACGAVACSDVSSLSGGCPACTDAASDTVGVDVEAHDAGGADGSMDTGPTDGPGPEGGPMDAPAEAPFACPGKLTDCGGTCVDLSKDPENCAACGRSCQGAMCLASICAPVVLSNTLFGSGPITLDATYVYWANSSTSGTIAKVPIVGGPTTTLASGQQVPTGIAVDATHVYWVNNQNGLIQSALLTGGAVPSVVGSNPGLLEDVAVQGTALFWTSAGTAAGNFTDGTVTRLPIGGSNPLAIATGQPVARRMAVDAKNVYWTDDGNGTVMQMPLTGGAPVTVATTSGSSTPYGIAVDAANIYWVEFIDPGNVWAVPIGGGVVRMIASGQHNAVAIATDGVNVYWVNEGTVAAQLLDGSVMTAPVGGGAVKTLVSMQQEPGGVAVDGQSVYWTTYGPQGNVLKATK